MRFQNSEGRSRTINLNDPKDNLTEQEVQTFMNSAIGVFVPSDYQIDSAHIVDTTTQELFNLL